MIKRILLSVLLPLTLLSACATNEAASYEPIGGVRVVVDPSASLLGSMRVWIVTTAGGPRLLGTIAGVSEDTLTIPFAMTTETYQLKGDLSGNRVIASQPFSVASSRQIVRWNLANNSVLTHPPPR